MQSRRSLATSALTRLGRASPARSSTIARSTKRWEASNSEYRSDTSRTCTSSTGMRLAFREPLQVAAFEKTSRHLVHDLECVVGTLDDALPNGCLHTGMEAGKWRFLRKVFYLCGHCCRLRVGRALELCFAVGCSASDAADDPAVISHV